MMLRDVKVLSLSDLYLLKHAPTCVVCDIFRVDYSRLAVVLR